MKKIIVMALILFIFASPGFSATVTNIKSFNPSRSWTSGSGTGKVMNIPTRYMADMTTGTGTITKWGTAVLPLITSNPIVGLMISAGLGVGLYYFDQWLNNNEIYHDANGYYINNPSSNLGTVTPTAGHVSYYSDEATDRVNMGYYHTGTEAEASMQAYANANSSFKGTTPSSVASLVTITTWWGRWCMTTTGQPNHPTVRYWHYPSSGTPYTEGVTPVRENKADSWVTDQLIPYLQQATTTNDMLRTFLENHQQSFNDYLATGSVPTGSTLNQSQLETLKAALLDNPDSQTEYYFTSSDFEGAPSVQDTEEAPAVLGGSSAAADDLAQAIDAKARQLEAENLQLEQDAYFGADSQLNGLGTPDFTGAFESSDVPSGSSIINDDSVFSGYKFSDIIDYMISNSPVLNIFEEVEVTSTGDCSFSFDFQGHPITFGVCAFDPFLELWGLVMGGISSLHCLMIIFRG